MAICGQTSGELASLYHAHRWKDLSQRLQSSPGFPLYRGALGITFDQDTGSAERLLLSIVNSAPRSPDAYEAYEWLSHLYFYRGQYRKLWSIMGERWSAFPQKKENGQERAVMVGFSGLPDQVLEQSRRSQVPHEPGSIFTPVSIEGKQATYFFDTGAWISCMSESEAKRLGLRIRESSGKLGQSAGSQVGFRTTVAAESSLGRLTSRMFRLLSSPIIRSLGPTYRPAVAE
jgi:hypothetical protein